MWIVLLWLLFSLLVGSVASGRGRGRWRWTLLAMLISPILAILLVLILPRRQ
jgi:hypothetical protein